MLTGKELNAPAYIAVTARACNPAYEDMRSQSVATIVRYQVLEEERF